MECLRVLIYNLVMNSLNFTKDGIVIVRSHKIENQFILEVADNGLGMTKEQIDNVLSGEQIIASANINNKKGTGLGYLIIKDLLKTMDGSFDIKSIKGKGATVIISMNAI
jgi:signal transduction histidine kinase